MIGIVKSRAVKKNRDGDAERILLQVEMHGEDVRTVELFPGAGVDVNPADGCRVEVVDANGVKISGITSDDLAPEVDPGEYEIYSSDSPAVTKKAKIRLASNGDITITAYTGAKIEVKESGEVIVNEGDDNVVKYSGYDADIQDILKQINTNLSAIATAITTLGGTYTPATVVRDTSASKSEDLLIP